METINHEYYVSPEVAKLLKEAGFDWECMKYYNHEVMFDMESDEIRKQCPQHSSYDVLAPTLDIAQRWLREAKNCYVSVVADCDSSGVFYTVQIIYYDTDNNYHETYVWEETGLERVKHRLIFNNYEEAQEAGIKKALELILEK